MKLTPSTARRVEALLLEIVAPTLTEPAYEERLVAEARALLSVLAPRRRIKHALPGVSRKAKRDTKRAEHREQTAYLRELAIERSRGICELCQAMPGSQLHHLKGGRGRRREQQNEINTIWVCFSCHREYHRDPKRFRDAVEDFRTRYAGTRYDPAPF